MTAAASNALGMALALGVGTALAQGHAHVHGLVRVDVAVDGPVLSVQLEAPLDSLVGFEHRPRTDAQRQAAAAAIVRLKDGAALWRPDAAARCSLTGTTLQADALAAAPAGAPAAGVDAHAELQAAYTYRCEVPDRLQALDHGLFGAFVRIRRIEVQVAGAQGQRKQTLQAPATRLLLR